jgi:hypothetical protein
MKKQTSRIKENMKNNGDLSRDYFLCEQDICNMVGKLAKKTYKKDENDAKSVKMWSLKIGKRFSSTKNLMFKLKETCMVVTCLSQLAYKLSGKRK